MNKLQVNYTKWIFSVEVRNNNLEVINQLKEDSKNESVKFMCFGGEYMKNTNYIEGYIEFHNKVDSQYIKSISSVLSNSHMKEFEGNEFDAVVYCARHLGVRSEWFTKYIEYLEYVKGIYYNDNVQVLYHPDNYSEQGNFIPKDFDFETEKYKEGWKNLSFKYGDFDRLKLTLLEGNNRTFWNANEDFENFRYIIIMNLDFYNEFYYEHGDSDYVSNCRSNYKIGCSRVEEQGYRVLYKRTFNCQDEYGYDKYYYGCSLDNFRF